MKTTSDTLLRKYIYLGPKADIQPCSDTENHKKGWYSICPGKIKGNCPMQAGRDSNMDKGVLVPQSDKAKLFTWVYVEE